MKCPHCGREIPTREFRLKAREEAGKKIDDAVAAFGSCAEDIRRFVGMAVTARPGGMGLGHTMKVLDEFKAMHDENPIAFAAAIEATLLSDKFDWRRPNLTGYVKAVFKAAKEQGPRPTIEDLADEMALAIIATWHRWKSTVTREQVNDLMHGKQIYHVIQHLQHQGKTAGAAPSKDKLAGFIRQLLARKEAKKKGLLNAQLPTSQAASPEAMAPTTEVKNPKTRALIESLTAGITAKKNLEDRAEEDAWNESAE